MRIEIDIDQSIRNERLKIYYKGFYQKFDRIFYIFFSAIIILIGLAFPIFMTVKNVIESKEKFMFPLIIYSPFIFLGLLSLYALITDNELTRFEGRTQELDNGVILGILERRLKIPINKNNERIIRIYKKATFWSWGTRIIIIFDMQDILINISRFNYRGFKSPFHPWFDDCKIKSMVREFNAIKRNVA